MDFRQQSSAQKLVSFASRRRRLLAAGVFFVIAAGGGFLWIAGHYKITLYPFGCGFKQRYGLPCPTCGYTTTAVTFARGNIIEAFKIQPAAAVFCCILALVAIFALLEAVFGIYSPVLESRLISLKLRYVFAVLATIVAAGWGINLLKTMNAIRQGG